MLFFSDKAKRTTGFVLALIIAAGSVFCTPYEASAKSKKNKLPAWAKGKVVAHAGGGISGTSYTNSVEALTQTLSKNVKCVELDFAWTSDNRLVCAHRSTAFRLFTPTEEQFLQTKISGAYTAMNASTALEMLYSKGDVYMIMDTQEKNAAGVYAEIKRILDDAGRPDYMSRIIPQIYKESQYSKYRKVYKFKSGIFTLYRVKPLTSRKLQKIAKFCKKKKLVVTISKSRYNSRRQALLRQEGVVVAVHTVNSKSLWKKLFKRGASVVYTDFII